MTKLTRMSKIDKNFSLQKIFGAVSVAMIFTGCAINQRIENYNTPLLVGKKKIFVSIAKTPEEKRQGLSGKEKLKDSQGILFDFSNTQSKTGSGPSTPSTDAQGRPEETRGATSSGQNAGKPAFWMKDMKFDLDLIWIREGKIIGITPNVPHPNSPSDKLPTYSPPSEINMVLEVNAGWSEKYRVEVGDEVRLGD